MKRDELVYCLTPPEALRPAAWQLCSMRGLGFLTLPSSFAHTRWVRLRRWISPSSNDWVHCLIPSSPVCTTKCPWCSSRRQLVIMQPVCEAGCIFLDIWCTWAFTVTRRRENIFSPRLGCSPSLTAVKLGLQHKREKLFLSVALTSSAQRIIMIKRLRV